MTTRETIEGYLHSLKHHQGWDSFLADAVTFTSHATPIKRLTGRDAVLEGTRGFYAMIEHVEVKQILVDGEAACALTRYTLQPPRGPAFESHVAEVFAVKDGKITSFDIYFDTAPFPR